jgi:hypothetical protein
MTTGGRKVPTVVLLAEDYNHIKGYPFVILNPSHQYMIVRFGEGWSHGRSSTVDLGSCGRCRVPILACCQFNLGSRI